MESPVRSIVKFSSGMVAAALLLFAALYLPPHDSLDYHPEYWIWLAVGICVIAITVLFAVRSRWAVAGVATGLLLTVAFWAAVIAYIIQDGGLD